LLGYVLSSG